MLSLSKVLLGEFHHLVIVCTGEPIETVTSTQAMCQSSIRRILAIGATAEDIGPRITQSSSLFQCLMSYAKTFVWQEWWYGGGTSHRSSKRSESVSPSEQCGVVIQSRKARTSRGYFQLSRRNRIGREKGAPGMIWFVIHSTQ
jgi:hypothetical protein